MEGNTPWLLVSKTSSLLNTIHGKRLTDKELHREVIVPAYAEYVTITTKLLVVFGWLLFFAALPHGQVSLETRNLNGSVYYVAHNGGRISNTSYANYTQGQFATTEGQGDAEALSRMSQYSFAYVLATLNSNQTINKLFETDWSAFVTGGVSDNSTYWKTWAGRQWNADKVNFTDEQQRDDDYILETLSFDGNENFPRDVYLAVRFNSTYFDSVTWSNDSGISNCLMNSTVPCIASNWTYLALSRQDNGWGWEFHNVSERGRLLVVYNNSAWVLWSIGRRVNGHVEVQYFKIDANPCQINCQPGDSATITYSDTGFGNVQCGYGLNNATAELSWTDTSGTCGLAFCAMGPMITNPYNRTAGAVISPSGEWNDSPSANTSWVTCVMDGPQASNCTYSIHDIAAVDLPTKNYLYDFYLTEVGRNNIALFSHTIKGCFFTDGGEFAQACIAATTPNVVPGSDSTAPNVSINFMNASNNTIYSTNGSLRYANWTPVFGFSDTGLVNNSCFLFSNWSGAWTCKDEPDFWRGSNSSTVLVNTSVWYRLMVRVNDTFKNSNLTIYTVAFNIIPAPARPSPTPLAAKASWRKLDDDEYPPQQVASSAWLFLLIPTALILVVALAQRTDRTNTTEA